MTTIYQVEKQNMAKVLIVDDSPTEVHIFSMALGDEGYQVVVATDGEEGVQKAMEEMPDLILMDVVMPGLNGFQATRKVFRRRARFTAMHRPNTFPSLS